jgi:O-methyltransferase
MNASIAQSYLELLKSSLLGEIYIENEIRLFYTAAMLFTEQPVDFDVVRNIATRAPDLVRQIREARSDGRLWWNWTTTTNGQMHALNLRNTCEFAHTMIGRKRLENIEHCLDRVRMDNIPGDVIETGVWRGGATIFMRGYLLAHGIADRTVWVADSFEGLPKPTMAQDAGYDFSAERMPILAVSLDEVKENFRRYGLLDGQVRFLKGWFKDTLHRAPMKQLSLARLDGDLYESTMDALEAIYEKVVPGGFIIVDDYGDFEPCRQAVDEFREKKNISAALEQIDWSGVFWRKQ